MDPTMFKRLVDILLYLTATRPGLASLGNTMEVVVDIVARKTRKGEKLFKITIFNLKMIFFK